MNNETLRRLQYSPSQGRPLTSGKAFLYKEKYPANEKKGRGDACNSNERMGHFLGDFALQFRGFITVFNFPLCYLNFPLAVHWFGA